MIHYSYPHFIKMYVVLMKTRKILMQMLVIFALYFFGKFLKTQVQLTVFTMLKGRSLSDSSPFLRRQLTLSV